MPPVYYLTERNLIEFIFPYVSKRYGKVEEVPDYANDSKGMPQVLGVLERVRMDTYYPTILEKAAYLLIAINKGHFFGNGNKRLALVTSTVFLVLNDAVLREESKEFYKELLSRLFPEYNSWTDFPDFSPTDYATYHLSIIIADSGTYNIPHDVLKERVLTFLKGGITT